ncbi:hypothetical protein KUTG_10022 [Kutzneria sp. 744]|nr:hypothetical protein KUTG_10022 [Kutzneria sp. 744]
MCLECHGAARFDQHDVYDRPATTPEVPVQPYTFASHEAMAVVLGAFNAYTDTTRLRPRHG